MEDECQQHCLAYCTEQCGIDTSFVFSSLPGRPLPPPSPDPPPPAPPPPPSPPPTLNVCLNLCEDACDNGCECPGEECEGNSDGGDDGMEDECQQHCLDYCTEQCGLDTSFVFSSLPDRPSPPPSPPPPPLPPPSPPPPPPTLYICKQTCEVACEQAECYCGGPCDTGADQGYDEYDDECQNDCYTYCDEQCGLDTTFVFAQLAPRPLPPPSPEPPPPTPPPPTPPPPAPPPPPSPPPTVNVCKNACEDACDNGCECPDEECEGNSDNGDDGMEDDCQEHCLNYCTEQCNLDTTFIFSSLPDRPSPPPPAPPPPRPPPSPPPPPPTVNSCKNACEDTCDDGCECPGEECEGNSDNGDDGMEDACQEQCLNYCTEQCNLDTTFIFDALPGLPSPPPPPPKPPPSPKPPPPPKPPPCIPDGNACGGPYDTCCDNHPCVDGGNGQDYCDSTFSYDYDENGNRRLDEDPGRALADQETVTACVCLMDAMPPPPEPPPSPSPPPSNEYWDCYHGAPSAVSPGESTSAFLASCVGKCYHENFETLWWSFYNGQFATPLFANGCTGGYDDGRVLTIDEQTQQLGCGLSCRAHCEQYCTADHDYEWDANHPRPPPSPPPNCQFTCYDYDEFTSHGYRAETRAEGMVQSAQTTLAIPGDSSTTLEAYLFPSWISADVARNAEKEQCKADCVQQHPGAYGAGQTPPNNWYSHYTGVSYWHKDCARFESRPDAGCDKPIFATNDNDLYTNCWMMCECCTSTVRFNTGEADLQGTPLGIDYGESTSFTLDAEAAAVQELWLAYLSSHGCDDECVRGVDPISDNSWWNFASQGNGAGSEQPVSASPEPSPSPSPSPNVGACEYVQMQDRYDTCYGTNQPAGLRQMTQSECHEYIVPATQRYEYLGGQSVYNHISSGLETFVHTHPGCGIAHTMSQNRRVIAWNTANNGILSAPTSATYALKYNVCCRERNPAAALDVEDKQTYELVGPHVANTATSFMNSVCNRASGRRPVSIEECHDYANNLGFNTGDVANAHGFGLSNVIGKGTNVLDWLPNGCFMYRLRDSATGEQVGPFYVDYNWAPERLPGYAGWGQQSLDPTQAFFANDGPGGYGDRYRICKTFNAARRLEEAAAGDGLSEVEVLLDNLPVPQPVPEPSAPERRLAALKRTVHARLATLPKSVRVAVHDHLVDRFAPDFEYRRRRRLKHVPGTISPSDASYPASTNNENPFAWEGLSQSGRSTIACVCLYPWTANQLPGGARMASNRMYIPPSASPTVLVLDVTWAATMDQISPQGFADTLAWQLGSNTSNMELSFTPGSVRMVARIRVNDRHFMEARANRLFQSAASVKHLFGVEALDFHMQGEDKCAEDGSDDVCDDWSTALWADEASEYYFYMYDDTEDGQDLKFWQWPRVDPTATFFRNNGFCEDGYNSTLGKPSGEYHIRFAAHCTSDSVTVSTGTYDQCGKVAYVPCKWGRDCHDCGRAVSSFPAVEIPSARRRLLPSLGDHRSLNELLETVYHGSRNGSIVDYSLPEPHLFWLERFDPGERRPTPFPSKRRMVEAFEAFRAARIR